MANIPGPSKKGVDRQDFRSVPRRLIDNKDGQRPFGDMFDMSGDRFLCDDPGGMDVRLECPIVPRQWNLFCYGRNMFRDSGSGSFDRVFVPH
jgi:hypothetical protein